MKLTIGIKALNEERHIAAALTSALAAAAPFGGEVILADSGSTDCTIEIARSFPVRIVQLADPGDRSCGAGAQLAFQHARGEYFYLLDGDMVLDPGFIADGIAYLEREPKVAGVGGQVREVNVANQEFMIRASAIADDPRWSPGIVDRLDCGGLYRTDAIRAAGYFADRNLHAFEEFDLAARLRAAGWSLARIGRAAVDHYGHSVGGYALLMRRLRSGYLSASGQVLRGAIGRPHLPVVLRRLGHIRNALAVYVWWVLLVAAAVMQSPLAIVALLVVPFAFLWFRRGSAGLALYSLASWNAVALGLAGGLAERRIDPRRPLPSVELSTGVAPATSAAGTVRAATPWPA